MATKYCDPSRYAAHVAGGTVPTAAEDGNGKASGIATMATLVITFTGIPAADGAITIAGLAFTAKASGAAGNQFNAVTSASQCATNLAAAINASATTGLSKPIGSISSTAPLRNVVNATVSGAVVTVYTRCSGSDWNSVTETSTLTNASITAQWSGGADGAWGYLINMAAKWPTSVAIAGYGLWSAQLPYVGSLAGDDVVFVRTNNITLAGPSSGFTSTMAAQGTVTAPVTYVMDDNSIWADGANKVLTISYPGSNAGITNIRGIATSFVNIIGKLLASGANSLQFLVNGLSNGYISIPASVPIVFENVDFFATVAATQSIYLTDSTTSNYQTIYKNCRIYWGSTGVIMAVSSVYVRATLINCIIRNKTVGNVNTGSVNTGIISNTVGDLALSFIGCQFTDFVLGSKLFGSVTNHSKVQLQNCDFGNVTLRYPMAYARATQGYLPTSNSVQIMSQLGQRDWSVETHLGIAEWNSSLVFPKRNALQINGVDKWVIRFCPSTYAGNVSRAQPFGLPRIGKINSLTATASRTVTVHFCVEKSLVWTKKDISVTVQYIDSTGASVTVDSYDYTGAALTSDEAGEWSQYGSGADAANVVWSIYGAVYFKQYKLVITCPDMAADCDVGVFMYVNTTVANETLCGFFDPDFDIV